ncbi:MAG: hypothetical protein EP343_34485 [Deltaproteobacteria bacterium]|nr:MAG: hypothetical protein EP343_34485 [Deltaproteobacteria bacterium]
MSKYRYRSRRTQQRGWSSVGFGILLVGVGVFFLLKQLGYLEHISIRTYWPMILVVIGAINFLFPKHSGERWNGLILLAVGTAFQLQKLDIIQLEWRFIWPILLIVVGLHAIFKPKCRKSGRGRGGTAVPGGQVRGSVVLGSRKTRVEGEPLVDAKIEVVMGSYELDLTQAILEKEAVIKTTAVMGSIELFLPKHWRVVSDVTPVMGSFEDHRRNPRIDDDAPVLNIRGEAVMGSIEVYDGSSVTE